jgi:diguanylate cyclase (GGDEF)-like protein/PAS domain S-box-containing protein
VTGRPALTPWGLYPPIGLLLALAYFLMPAGLSQHLLYGLLGLSSVAAIVYGVRQNNPREQLPWYLLAAGQLGFVLGDGTRAVYESLITDEAPFPSLADAFYLSAYPVLAVGLVLLIRSRDHVRDRGNVIDAMIVVTSVGLLSWLFLMEPYTNDSQTSALGIAISMAYPLADLLLLAVIAQLMVSPGGRPPSYYLLGAGLVGLLVADSLYLLTVLDGTYHTGSYVDAGYLVSYVLLGTCALHPSMRQLSEPVYTPEWRITGRRLLLLTCASLLAPMVWIFESLRGNDPGVGSTAIPTILLFVLVMARMSGLVKMLSAALERNEEAESRRRESEERFGSLVQNASDLVTVIDVRGEISYQSTSAGRVLGYGRGQLMGQSLADLMHPDDRVTALAVIDEMTRGKSDQPARLEYRCKHRDGTWVHVETTATNMLSDPAVAGIVLNTRDVTERIALQEQLEHQAFHDPLTGLANRALFRDRVEHALQLRSAPDEPISVLFLDVDDFKTINDSLGHSAGDALLTELAERIRSCLRAGDTPARLGGDEFAILLEETESADSVAARIGDALRDPFRVEGKELFVTTSIGISVSELAQGGADELLRNADAAMYTAKSRGKARSVVFNPEMHVRALRRLELEAELRRAVERNEMRVHYQPLVEVGTGRIGGFEALVRWAHPERGLLSPTEFISIAEQTGLIHPLGRLVLEEAVQQLRKWQTRFPDEPELTMSVNLAPEQLQSKNLVKEVNAALGMSGIDPATLVLEMTERVLMRDTKLTVGRLKELKSLGVSLSVDDFGTGFSSLSYLRQFPVDALKIAKPFLDGMPGEKETSLVRGIVELARNLELDVVAEGVERAEQWEMLIEMRCDLVQGYLVARPQGPARIERLLEGVRTARARGDGSGVLSPEALIGLGAAAAA